MGTLHNNAKEKASQPVKVAARRVVGAIEDRPRSKVWGDHEEVVRLLMRWVHNNDKKLGVSRDEVRHNVVEGLRLAVARGELNCWEGNDRVTYTIPKSSTHRRTKREKRMGTFGGWRRQQAHTPIV